MNKFASMLSRLLYGWYIDLAFIKGVKGKNNMPRGNFILASNHLSHIDYFIHGYLCTPRKFTFIGQIDKMAGFMGVCRDLFYGYAGVIPVNRKDRDSKKQAIARALEMLAKGYCLVIYPEGARSRDGKLREFKPGVAKLHLESGVPVLPAAIKGTYELMPPGAKFKARKIARINIGKPLDFAKERVAARNLDKDSPEYYRLCSNVAKNIEDEVQELLQD